MYVFASAKNPGEIQLEKARVFYNSSQFDSSLRYYHQAAIYFKSNSADSLTFACKNKIGEIYLIKGLVDSSKTILLNNAQNIKNKIGVNSELLAVCYDLLGDYFMFISDAEVALKYYKLSLSIRTQMFGNNDPHVAYSISNLARYHNFKIDKTEAFKYGEKAFKMYKEFPLKTNDLHYERIITEYAYAYKILKRKKVVSTEEELKPVRSIYEEALKYVFKTYGHQSYFSSRIYRVIGNTYTDRMIGFEGNDHQKSLCFNMANYYYDLSKEIVRKYLGNQNTDISTLYYVKGLLYEYSYLRDSTEKTLYNFDKSIQALLPQYQSNSKFTNTDLNKCLYKYDLMTAIFAKGNSYFNLYCLSGEIRYLKESYELFKYQPFLWDCIIDEFESSYANRLVTIYGSRIYDHLIENGWILYLNEKNESYLNDIFLYSEKSKTSLQNKLLIESGNSISVNQTNQMVNIRDIQNALKDDKTLFIEYFDTTMVIGISKDTFIVKKINNSISPDTLNATYYRAMKTNNADLYSRSTHQIYTTFLEPVLNEYDNKFENIIIAPDGIITAVSFAGLVKEVSTTNIDFRTLHYLGNEIAFRYVLSGKNFVGEIPTKKPAKAGLLAFSPSFKQLTSLPFSEKLVNKLSTEIIGSSFIDEEATIVNFNAHAPNYNIIHLSTHAEANSNTKNGKIYFSDKIGLENYLNVDSIYKLKLNAQLVVLSACETNVGNLEYGEGSINFARAFIYAGCESTLTTQWKVDDKVSASLLTDIYSKMIDGIKPMESLQLSQLHYLENCNTSREANPILWSGFILTGKDHFIKFEKKSYINFYSIFSISGVIVLTGLFAFHRKKINRKEIKPEKRI